MLLVSSFPVRYTVAQMNRVEDDAKITIEGGGNDSSLDEDVPEPANLGAPVTPVAVMGYEVLDPLPERLNTWEPFPRPSAVLSYGHFSPLTGPEWVSHTWTSLGEVIVAKSFLKRIFSFVLGAPYTVGLLWAIHKDFALHFMDQA